MTQPACGNSEPHLPHNGFAGNVYGTPEPWCHGVPNMPRGRSLDDLLYDAFREGCRTGLAIPGEVVDSVEIRAAFADWRRTLR